MNYRGDERYYVSEGGMKVIEKLEEDLFIKESQIKFLKINNWFLVGVIATLVIVMIANS